MCIKISHAAFSASTATGNAVGQLFWRLVQKHLINQEEEEEEEVEVKCFSRDLNSACMHACKLQAKGSQVVVELVELV
jgi:hypothetical protein